MTRRRKILIALGGSGVLAGALVLFSYPLCACSLAPIPVPPSQQVVEAVDSLARLQETHYRALGEYSDSLPELAAAELFAPWEARIPIANAAGFDLLIFGDTVSCAYRVRRVSNDTTVRRSVHCNTGP